ncbi:hypothetical protein ACFPK1_00730 [Actinomycetospora rhizophila]|uniref:Uncharacterized protein n=1 Tax=Actinomycetospora rhizophila TaxID=1416876 RepID=A0ABV9Z957_9PSEU
MTNDRSCDQRDDDPGAGHDAIDRDEVTRLFAAALQGDRCAEAALNLLGGFDNIAHRATIALAAAGPNLEEPPPSMVLASIDRTLAALRVHRPSS